MHALLSRILGILNLVCLQHARSVRGVNVVLNDLKLDVMYMVAMLLFQHYIYRQLECLEHKLDKCILNTNSARQ